MNVLNVSVALVAAVLAAIGTELLSAPEATAQRLVGTVSNHECHDCIPGDGGGGSSLVSEGSAFCIDGFAGSFPCDNVDLSYYYDIADIGGGEGNEYHSQGEVIKETYHLEIDAETGRQGLADENIKIYQVDAPNPNRRRGQKSAQKSPDGTSMQRH